VGAARGHDFSNHNINERRPVKSAWEMKGSVLAAESASAVGVGGGGCGGDDDKRASSFERRAARALEMNSNSKHNRAQRDKWLSIKGLMLLALL
jgi:hypothetical protein